MPSPIEPPNSVRMEDLLGRESIGSFHNAEVDRRFRGRRMMVTGAAGSIGSELTRQLKRLQPAGLILLDKDENGLYEIGLEIGEGPNCLVQVLADIRDRQRLEHVFGRWQPQVVFHAAAYKHVPMMERNPSEAILTNVLGTRNLAELSFIHRVESLVLISTDKAVNPTSVMGASKRAAELIVQQKKFQGAASRFCVVRFGNVLGSRASVVPIFQKRIAEGKSLKVTHPEIRRFFMTIPEAVQLVIQAGAMGHDGEIFLLDMGDPVKIIDLARGLIELSGLVPEKDIPIEITGLRAGEKLYEELLIDAEKGGRPTEHPKIYAASNEQRSRPYLDATIRKLETAAREVDEGSIYQLLEGLEIGYHNISRTTGHNPEGSGIEKKLPMTSIPMSRPDIGAEETRAVTELLRSGQVSRGPAVDGFEAAFAEYIGTRFAVAVNAGTSGLHLAMIAAGVEEGDLVVTTPFSFVASANCILYQRAIPVFVDVDPRTGNIDPDQAAAAISDLSQGGEAGRRWLARPLKASAIRPPKAVLPVHTFGRPAEVRPLQEVAQRHGTALVEDACEALGAEYQDRKAGSLGDAAVFGFYANKQITTGEGGMIVTDQEDWARLFRSLRNQGRDAFGAGLQHDRMGFNYRMDAISAALGLVQLSRIRQLLRKRQQVAAWYAQELSDLDWVERPPAASGKSRLSWFTYVIRVRPPACRETVREKLAGQGIPSRIYFPPIHLQKPFREAFGYRRGDFPVAEKLGSSCLALPFSGVMPREQVERVCRALRQMG